MAKNLVIVESPAKAKTIEKILGKDFKVQSSFGHIRDLAKGNDAIEIDNKFHPRYIVSEKKKEVVSNLKKAVKGIDQVWLATDEDREGEAISWHLCEVLGLNVANTKRIVFHEITRPAIEKAVQNPRTVDMNLVSAQQARRVLDRLVGFELSPILWRKVSRSTSLSAGRVQSVAVRIIVEREQAIKEFVIKPHFNVSAIFEVTNDKGETVDMKAEAPQKFTDEAGAAAFLESCKNAVYTISKLETKPAKRKPQPPFTTSTLQQDASRKLGFSVSRTMIVAQKLYEAGKITYMRTDSVNLSEVAIDNAALAVMSKFGTEYVEKRQYKTKKKDAQEAHEAIRPSYFEQDTVTELGNDEKRLYELIWKRAIASQMADAQLERTTATINISTNNERLVAKGEVLKFDGFLSVYQVSKDEDEETEDRKILPPLSVGQALTFSEMTAIERFNRPPARYTEASLVKQMEELGIGRPSTYAPTIATIQKRTYVVKESREGFERFYKIHKLSKDNIITSKTESEITGAENNKLFPTDMGILVTEFLVDNFGDILNYDFTAQIESEFDEIAAGKMKWFDMLETFYHPFHKKVVDTMETAERVTGQRDLGTDPKTGKPIIARLGKFGPMIQLGGANQDDENDKPKFAKIPANKTLSSVTLEDALEMLKLPRILGENENGETIKANAGRFGPYVQLGKIFASIPKDSEFDLYSVTLQQAIQLIKDKQAADAAKIIKVFMEDEDISILKGRWGPYIKSGKDNVKLPADLKAEFKGDEDGLIEKCKTFSFDEVKDMIKNAPPPKKKRAAAKKKKS